MNILVPTAGVENEEVNFERTSIDSVREKFGSDIAEIILHEPKLRDMLGPCMVSKFYDFLHYVESKPDIRINAFSSNEYSKQTGEPATFMIYSNGISKNNFLFANNKGLQITKKEEGSITILRTHSFQTAPLVLSGGRYHIDANKANRYETSELIHEIHEGDVNSSLAIRVTPKYNFSYPIIEQYVKGNEIIDSAHKHIYELLIRLRKEMASGNSRSKGQLFSIEEIAYCAGIMRRLVGK